ncbi:putative pectinesterase 55 [Abeliophyllum distichum]|uniref:Pectinesterase n=1 Tax=Abeliophyllum distichum TaxID=126358 RepID=A0ABD1PVV6_9LAMI
MSSIYILAVFLCFRLTNGIIYVDPGNPYSFPTIQSAIDSVPSNNNQWFEISIKEGVFNEKVTIPSDKPFIHLKGEGMERTMVVWGDGDSIATSSTISFLADNTFVSRMTFVNSHNYPPKDHTDSEVWAVAARISGDKSAFYKCSFLGFQDTLYDEIGRHYFKDCTIEGAVDFIFGDGQSIYEQCRVLVNGGNIGWITAQGRLDENSPTGFVFNKCMITKISGGGKTFLGRAWKAYSRVIYYKSIISNIIVPEGWDDWQKDVNQLTFVEHECRGSGYDMSKRVEWVKKLSPQELQAFTNISYIDNEGWIKELPIDVFDQ